MNDLRSTRHPLFRPDLPLVLVLAMIVLLWIAGGASRADTLGQVVVRAGCWTILVIAALAGPRPLAGPPMNGPAMGGARPVLLLLAATIAMPLIQSIPLPPTWWQALPGRQILLIPGEPVGWRPWTMTPSATRNALAALVVPATVLLLLTQANERLHRWLPAILLGMIVSAMLLGLLQFSGAHVSNPFINDTPGLISSTFANRNHFALLLAIGCLIAPVWAFMDREALRWRGPLAGGLFSLFVLTILATGSRSGILLGTLAPLLALLLIGRRLRRRLRHLPRWLFPALVIAAVLVIAGFVALSLAADRADGINRLILLNSREDMRTRALPTVLSMIAAYMPFGSGFGGFDSVFRIHEPLDLLKPTYFNQAHNDYLGIALDGGIAGIVVLIASIGWWLVATIRVWRTQSSDDVLLGRLGSATIFLVLAASATDYPARTPTIMALLVIAAVWLGRANSLPVQTALPN